MKSKHGHSQPLRSTTGDEWQWEYSVREAFAEDTGSMAQPFCGLWFTGGSGSSGLEVSRWGLEGEVLKVK